MTIVHISRIVKSVLRGLYQHHQHQKSNLPTSSLAGIKAGNPHIFKARAGLLDIDQFGHVNNASYMSIAEYARWELCAALGMMDAMYKNNAQFIISSASCRFRAEIRMLKKIEVHSTLCSIDETSGLIYQTFHYPEEGNDRIRAQVVTRGLIVQNKKVLDPRKFVLDHMDGFDEDIVKAMSEPFEVPSIEDTLTTYKDLEAHFKHAATVDDQQRLKKK